MTAKVSKKNSFSTLSYQVLWLGSGIRLPRTIPLGPEKAENSSLKVNDILFVNSLQVGNIIEADKVIRGKNIGNYRTHGEISEMHVE